MEFRVEILAEVPNAVVARRRLAATEATRDLVLEPHGGSERRIVVTIDAADRAAAQQAALDLVQLALGDSITGERWVEGVTDPDDEATSDDNAPPAH